MVASAPMGRRVARYILALALGAAALPAAFGEGPGTRAAAGRADLSAIRRGSAATLDARWEFHWLRLVNPRDFEAGGAGRSLPVPDVYAPFPGEWKDYPVPGIEPLGYATYRLRLEGLDPALPWALRIGSILSAARLYANGVEVASFGVPGVDAASEVPDWGSLVVELGPPRDGSIDLVLQVSNFADRSGGARTNIEVGDRAALEEARDRQRLWQAFVFGALLAMGLYYLFLHAFRPADRSTLHFALLCLALALRTFCYDEYLVRALLPGLPWTLLFKLGYLTFSLSVLFFAGYLREGFRELFARPVFLAIAAFCAAYSACIAFAPTLASARLLVGFQAATLATGLYSALVLARAAAGRRRGALGLSLGFLVFFATAIHDILAANGLVRGPFLVQAGLLVFLFSTSASITRTFAAAFARAESLSEELARGNRAMRRFVPGEFLARLGKSSIEEVVLGDHAAEEMTVLFADIRSFSSISERMGPEETFRFINQYLARVSPSVRAHGGFVDKYMGDGIMALFPGSPEDAVRCAIDIQRRLAEYNGTRAARGEEPVRAGIGVHRGRLMLGTIGEIERMDGTVVSDAVNTASRMEGISKEYDVGVAASEAVIAGLDDPGAYRFRFLGKVGVKGRREPVSAFELYDGDPEPLRSRKDAIRADFERALAAFYDQEYDRALGLFKSVLERMPADEASHHYVRIIRKLSLA